MIHWSGVKFCPPPHPTPRPHTHSGWGLLWLHRPQSKVFWSGSYRFYLPSIFIGPNYGAVLAIITFYHQFRKGSGGRSVVLAPFPPPSSSLTPPHFVSKFGSQSSLAAEPLQFNKSVLTRLHGVKTRSLAALQREAKLWLAESEKKKQRWHILSSRPGLKRGFQIVLTH